MRNDMVEWAEEENGKKGNGSEREIKKETRKGERVVKGVGKRDRKSVV